MDLPPPPIPADIPEQSSGLSLPDLPDLETPPAPLPDLKHQEEFLPSPDQAPEEYDQYESEQPLEIQQPSYQQPYVQQVHEESDDLPPMIEEQEIQRETTGLVPQREPVSPLFVSTNDYQAILAGIQQVRKTLGDSETIIAHLAEIKNNQEKIFSDWKNSLEDIEKKISYVDQIIVKSQEMNG